MFAGFAELCSRAPAIGSAYAGRRGLRRPDEGFADGAGCTRSEVDDVTHAGVGQRLVEVVEIPE